MYWSTKTLLTYFHLSIFIYNGFICLFHLFIFMNLNLTGKYQAIAHTGEAGEFTLSDLLSFSKKTLLFFYPKDNTPGCTVENKDFSCLVDDFKKL